MLENAMAYKRIPFVGKQPARVLRWKMPVYYAADDGIYETCYR